MIIKDEWLIVGLITSCHGIIGQVKVKSLSDFDERFLKPGIRWLQKANETPTKIELSSGFKQPGKGTFIIKLKGINTGIYYPKPLSRMKAFQNIHKKHKNQFKNSEKVCKEILSIPIGPHLNINDSRFISNAIQSFLSK